ncbi:MAG: hypothetical protein EPO07_02625 [Verrucomicrobia bacterium]|nr:MAG: hypothetical protein EPO07_02625 [Verrucomicrobiota bacterium]
MLLRISLVVAILAALAVGVLNFVQIKPKIDTLVTQRDTEKRDKETAQNDLRKTKDELAKTEKDLKQTKETLAETSAERDTAVKTAADQTKKATELAEKLEKANSDLGNARAELAAYQATGYKPEQIAGLGKQIKSLEEAVFVAQEETKKVAWKLKITENELAKLVQTDFHVRLPADLKGKVAVTDPKWDFVVLDFGANKEALPDAELLVSRNGKLVGKLRISAVQNDRCIANVVGGDYRIGDVSEGDVVIPAYPAL